MSARRRTCRNEHGSPRPSHSRVALVQRRAVFVSTVAIYDARHADPEDAALRARGERGGVLDWAPRRSSLDWIIGSA